MVGAPAGLFSPELDGAFVVDGSHEVDGEMPDDGHVEGAMALSKPRLMVVEDDIEGPIQSVLDQPVAAHGVTGPSVVSVASVQCAS